MEFDLEDAVRRFPLPEDQPDAVVNRGQCATALGVSENIVTKYLEQGMPVLTRGSNGQAYEFQLSECYAWKMARDDEVQSRRDAGDRAAAQMALLFRGHDEDAGDDGVRVPTAAEIILESEADYKRNKAAELRRELVRAARVREMFEDVLTQVRSSVVALVDFAEIEFGLSPEQVAKMQMRCDGALVQMRQAFGEACPGEVAELAPHRPLADKAEKGGDHENAG